MKPENNRLLPEQRVKDLVSKFLYQIIRATVHIRTSFPVADQLVEVQISSLRTEVSRNHIVDIFRHLLAGILCFQVEGNKITASFLESCVKTDLRLYLSIVVF